MSADNRTVIEGEFTDAVIHLNRDEIEDGLYEQVEDLTNNPAFQNTIHIMPDAHVGTVPIGLTMPITNRVAPGAVSVDIGCSVYAFKLEDVDFDPDDEDDLHSVDLRIRDLVPTGRQIVKQDTYHMKNQFPWEKPAENWRTFAENHLDDIPLGEYHPDSFTYDINYFKELCKKVGYDLNRAIGGVGSLGGGNHYIELALDSNDSIWGSVHSGSRGLGYSIGEYHINRAKQIREVEAVRRGLKSLPDSHRRFVNPDLDTVSDGELHQWIHNKQIVDYDGLKGVYEGTEDASMIEEISNVINGVSRGNFSKFSEYLDGVNVKELEATQDAGELAYLEGEEALEYYVDMAFAQVYASESRKKMARAVAHATGGRITETIESVHNYIDYEDGIMRKGATPAQDGQMAIIPMNMSFGSFIVRGKGNADWHYSAPHGAGRAMSRRQAYDELDEDEFRDEMGDTFASELPLDEAPQAYKDVDMVRAAMEPTVEIVDRLEPFLNLKADD